MMRIVAIGVGVVVGAALGTRISNARSGGNETTIDKGRTLGAIAGGAAAFLLTR